MARSLRILGLLFVVACASAPEGAPEPEPASQTEGEDPEAREAREEVLAAEAARREAAFRDRLDALRSAEETRFAERAKDAPPPPKAPPPTVLQMAEELNEVGGRASDRARSAVEAARPPSPSPRELLKSARCLLTSEDERIFQRMQRARAEGSGREEMGAWAGAMVEVQGLLAEVERQILASEPLAKVEGRCKDDRSQLVRPLFGPGASTGTPTQVTAGALRLRQELTQRAGLAERDDGAEPDPRPRRQRP